MGRVRDFALDEHPAVEQDKDTPLAQQARHRQRRQRDTWFMLAVLALGVVTVYALSLAGNALGSGNGATRTANVAPTTTAQAATPAPTSAAQAPASGAASASVIAAQAQSFAIPPDNAGLMEDTVDAQGNIWFGEMNANKLARFEPQTGAITTWTPPNGEGGIMGTALDASGNIWFAEAAANYIGRFNPTTQQFTTYPLERVNGNGISPENVQFDVAGNLWFTADAGGRIGRVDPATGAVKTWIIPSPPSGGRSYPFALAVTHSGQVWFGDLTGGAIGRLDPTTGHVQFISLPNTQAQVFAMTLDPQGRLWFTELAQGTLGMLDIQSGAITEYHLPATLGDPSGLYDVVTAANGDIWFTCGSDNALVRFTPTTRHFTFYTLPTPQSAPYGLALAPKGALWFTADNSPNNYLGMMHP